MDFTLNRTVLCRDVIVWQYDGTKAMTSRVVDSTYKQTLFDPWTRNCVKFRNVYCNCSFL